MIKYRCPVCGGTSLRVEATIVITLDGNDPDNLEFPSFEHLPGLFDLHDDSYVACNNEHCEHEGALRTFKVSTPTPTE